MHLALFLYSDVGLTSAGLFWCHGKVVWREACYVGALSGHGANAERGWLQTLLVAVVCCGAMGLLPGCGRLPREALAKARHPWAILRSPFRAGVSRSGGAKQEMHSAGNAGFLAS